jgi:hypothetical protein
MKEECMGNKAKQAGGMGKGSMARLPRSPESSPGLWLGSGFLRYTYLGGEINKIACVRGLNT